MQITSSELAPYVELWRPGPVATEDVLSPAPVTAFSAVLDLQELAAGHGEALPPLWHWLHFLDWPAQADLGGDGHPRNGHFLPPIPHRQRMFAGGRCKIVEPLRLGERTHRISSVQNMTTKKGSTGELLFVCIRSEFLQQDRTCVIEEQDIVYRQGRGSANHPVSLDTTAVPHSEEPWTLPLQPDPTLLFRFSALTANAHRIHYDAPYARGEEGYPDLVVHGPLLVLSMLELVRRNAPDRRMTSVAYRLRRPAFAGEHLLASGVSTERDAVLRIATHREERHATAEVTFA